MKAKYLNITSISILLMGILSTPVLASDERFVITAPPVNVDELGQMRDGITIPKVKEIVVVGLRSHEAVESVVPGLSGVVVLAAMPTEVRRGINQPDLVEGLKGVPEVAGGISEFDSLPDLSEGSAAAERGDYATMLRVWKIYAAYGEVTSQYNLGIMYGSGKGVPQDYAEAAKWHRLAAEQGLARAQNNLGSMYGNGHGVPQDYVRAHMWFSLAVAQGNEIARRNRDMSAERMTPADILKAQNLAREWMGKHGQ